MNVVRNINRTTIMYGYVLYILYLLIFRLLSGIGEPFDVNSTGTGRGAGAIEWRKGSKSKEEERRIVQSRGETRQHEREEKRRKEREEERRGGHKAGE